MTVYHCCDFAGQNQASSHAVNEKVPPGCGQQHRVTEVQVQAPQLQWTGRARTRTPYQLHGCKC